MHYIFAMRLKTAIAALNVSLFYNTFNSYINMIFPFCGANIYIMCYIA